MPEDPADASFAHTTTATCPACGASHTADIWLIVAPDERPDLLEQIRNGALHTVTCPQCGQTHTPDAPLLIFRPTAEPPILFAPAQQTTSEQDQQHAAALIGILRQHLGAAWNDAWLAQGPAVVPRPMLPAVLADDPAAALQGLAARMQQALAELRRRDPEAFARLEAEAQQAMAALLAADQTPDEAPASTATTDAPALIQALDAFLNARTWIDSYRQVQAHPELLSDEALAMLDQAIAAARAANNADAVAFFEAHRALLRRCREVGAAAAFAEKIGVSVEQIRGVDAETALPPEVQQMIARITQLNRISDMPERVELCRQALTLVTRATHPRLWAALNVELGNSLVQNPRGERGENLEQAIALYQQALAVITREAMPVEWATTMMNLATAYSDRIRGDRAQNLEEAIAAYRQALEVMTREAMPVEWATTMMNLATAYYSRIRGDRAQNLEEAIAAYRQALEIFTPEGMPVDCRRVARGLANLCFVEGRYDQVIEPYRLTMRANELLLQASLARSSKEVELGEIQGLPASAAYAFARLDRLEESIVALETGRARMLAEALEANRRDLERLPASGHGDLLARYRAAADRLAALQAQVDRPAAASGSEAGPRRDFAALSQKIQAARAELDAAIAAIRRVPGYEDFFLPPAFEKICQAATPDAPLVYLAATPVGGMALMVHASQTPASASEQGSAEHDASPDNDQTHRVSVVWLDDLTEARLREVISGPADDPALGGYLGAYNEWRRNPRNQAARDGWHAALDRVTRWLWDALMGPLVEHVQALGVRQVTLIPTGLLALLPLHAAWTGDASAPIGRRYALDVLTIRYAPSAVALGRSLDGATLPSDGLLAVDNPDGSLVFSNHEVEVARSYFPSDRTTVLARGAATRQHVLNRLPDFPVYHFSTHGWAGWSEPLQGGVLLAGGAALTLGDILDLRLQGARLAVLSACETGIPGTKTPDEVVSIPTGLMQAGVAGVVASLWAVNELSTAMLMERFYRLWREEGLAPVAALREAQRWLRDTTNREKAEYFKRDAPALAGFRVPEMVAVELFTDRMVQDPDARQFEHPFWWAAFCYTGA